MNNFQEKLLNLFKNTELLKSVRTGLFIGIVIILPLYYFGYKDTFGFDRLFNPQYGIISLITTVSVIIMIHETKLRAFDINYQADESIHELHEKAQANASKITLKDKTLKRSTYFIDDYNQAQQNMYNEILTNETVMRLENKARDYRLKGKLAKAESTEKRIKDIKETGMVDNKFEPYDIRRIVIVERNTIKLNRKKGNPDISVDPKAFNPVKTLMTSGLRGLGLGITASLTFVISESARTIFWFYFTYLLIITASMLVQYIASTYIIQNAYKRSLKSIVKIQELLLEELEKGSGSVSESRKGEKVDVKAAFARDEIF